ncbi:hypothetical protein N752_28490 [Desulforamulus aquiferis]|nr:hypothetical protein [Desulforamulus aquiferis]RYD01797.1 hypothetical protein N752_28490 [Desulforamulus aquiferis]
MSSRKRLIILLIACILILGSGCVDVEHRDIDRMYFVMGALFDYDPEKELYEVHTQVLRPGPLQGSRRGTGGGHLPDI